MYLIIQIPCLNEEKTLPLVIAEIPRYIPNISRIEIQVIDDGSTDNTIAVAEALGVHHIVQNIGNKGLGNSFRVGIENAINLGADILVNTDGDNQYPSKYIPQLIKPIINQQADIVVGNRQTNNIEHFSYIKKFFQRLGTIVTKQLTGDIAIKDAVSGFRAYSRQALLELNVTSSFSYVLDTTIQAAKKRIKMVSVDIETNAPTRPSRLFNGIAQHIRKSSLDLVRVYAMYQPMKVFFLLGSLSFLVGLIPSVRFLYYFFYDNSDGKIQSLLFGVMCIIISINLFSLGIIGDLQAKNRILIEDILKKQKLQELSNAKKLK